MKHTYPWESDKLLGWDIVGMNHYVVGVERFLYVAMTYKTPPMEPDICITSQGTLAGNVWANLEKQAVEIKRLRSVPRVYFDHNGDAL